MIRFRIDPWDNPDFKGVEIRRWTPQIAEALEIADEWSRIRSKTVIINSIDDSVHGSPSFHGFSLAIDFDDENDDHRDLASLYRWLAFRLPPQWDVLNKGNHIHTEYDPKYRGGAKPWEIS